MSDKIAFYLDKPNTSGKAFIFVRYYCKDGDFRYSTKQQVYHSEWKKDLQLSTDRNINKQIDKIHTILEQYLSHCRIMGKDKIFKKDLETELNEKLGRVERAKFSHFYQSFDLIIEEAKSGKLLTPKRLKYSESTIKNFTKLRERLYRFDPNLEFSSITLQTYFAFLNHCNEKNYTVNYTGTFIKNWKTIMGIAMSKGMHKNLIFRHKEFRKMKEYSHQVYLNEEEIQQLYEVKDFENKKQEVIRDRFVINLYSGLRVSDMKTLSVKNIYNGMLTHINQKTKQKVVMPVHPMIKKILEKYNGNMPKQYHENEVNRQIKKMAKKAGLTEMVHFTKTVGGVTQTFAKEKWEMVTCHTSRRSMATNLLKYATVLDVMPVMGMSMQTLQHYNKRSAEENAQMLKSNPFFT